MVRWFAAPRLVRDRFLSRRRPKSRRQMLSEAVRAVVEPLEPRMMLSLLGSSFESGDGNLVLDTSGNIDWVNAPNLVTKNDTPSGQNDDSLSGSEDDMPPGVGTGSVDNKTDLVRFYVSHETVNNTTDFLYLAWVRNSDDTSGPNGNANVDFEFNQSNILSSNGVTPVRTAGDLLITYDFTNGGNVTDINYRVWDGTDWGAATDLSAAGFAEAAVNSVAITDPVSGSVTLAPRTFGEAAIDLTAAGIFQPNNFINFGYAYVKSRASSSFNSTLKDFIAPQSISVSNGAMISGTKFNDLDGDGVWDNGEPGVGGVTINLEDTNGVILQSKVTNPDGSYAFAADTGTYRLREETPSGWVQTTANPADFAVVLRQQSPGHDFGNFQLVTLSGAKYTDKTGDGLSADDTPLAGVTIKLYADTNPNGVLDAGDSVVGSTTSAAVTGAFSFSNVGPGTYFVSETVPAGYLQTTPGNNGYYTVVASSGQNASSLNFANVANITLSGTKFNDQTGDGITGDDTTLQGVTINLYLDLDNSNTHNGADGAPVASMQTLADGTYAFHNLLPGRYFVEESVPAGWVRTVPGVPAYYTVNAVNTAVTGLDFADFQLVAISGKKVTDITGDGLSADDTGLGGVTINLYRDSNPNGVLDGSDTLVDSKVTAAGTGAFAFTGVGPGKFFVAETVPVGYAEMTPTGTGYYTVSTTSGVPVTGEDFANFKLETISGRKVTDITGDGLSGDDTGLGGVTITLYQDTNPNGVFDGSDAVVDTKVTAAVTGAYAFNNVGPGKYFVVETVPGGYMQTAPASGTYTVTTSSLGDSTGNDFANFQLVSISGKKVTDITGDGLSADDTGLGGVTINLYLDDGSGVWDAGDALAGTTTTAAGTGAYSFSDLGPGKYFVTEETPSGTLQTAPAGTGYYTVTATSGLTLTGKDFANFKLETISGRKVTDITGNGVSADDTGLGGVTIKLYKDTNPNGVFDGSDTLADSTISAAGTGAYAFNDVAPGKYFVVETVPGGYLQTAPASGTYTITTSSLGDSTGNDFANFQLISISGKKVTDITGDGLSADDTGLGGVTIKLYRDDGSGVWDAGDTLAGTTTTAAGTGAYSFSDLGPGKYFVTEVVPAGTLETAPTGTGYYTVNATSGLVLTAQDFANFKLETISGRKVTDITGNGLTADDTGLGGVTIKLYQDTNPNGTFDGSDTLVDSKVTAAGTGDYAFNNVGPGKYFVVETVPGGYLQTAPASGIYTITTSSLGDSTGNDFANYQLGAISGKKVTDITGNGLSADDTGLSGVTINLYMDADDSGTWTAGDTLADSTTTAAGTGAYGFSNLGPGKYFVTEVAPAGTLETAPAGTGYYTVSGTSGMAVTGKDFANFRLEMISGRKVTDITGDGVTADDTGLGGVTITLYQDTNPNGVFDGADALVDSTTSAVGTGAYAFNNVAPGKYFVVETVPAGYVQTGPASGTYTITTSSLGDSTGNDFANYQLGSIAGKKVTDITGNGLSADDTARAGVTINLYQDSDHDNVLSGGDNLAGTTTTAAGTGAYGFSNLGPGKYFVTETVPAGYLETAPAGTGYYTVSGTSGMAITSQDFANFKLETISGRKVTDITGNGVSADDTGLGGVTIKLYQDTNPNGVFDGSDTLMATTTSAAVTGAYAFNNVGPGKYFVVETVPAGYMQTGPVAGLYTVTTSSAGDSTGNDFANFQLISISGKKVLDITGDGLTADDTGMSGVTINLYKDANASGTYDAGDTLVGTSASAAVTGAYAFNNLGPGKYFVTETVPAGYIQTAPTAPTYYTVNATSGLVQTGENFANFRLEAITGRKVTDITGNGVSADDTGLGGVTIKLYKDTNPNGTLDGSDTLMGTTTSAAVTGAYAFNNVGPGTYFVVETVPNGYLQTGPASGSFKVTTTSLGDSTGNDFANFQFASISGKKVLDIFGDGVTADDTGLGGVTITLYKDANNSGFYDAGDTVSAATTTTAGTGAYAFNNVAPGKYFVVETVPSGFIQTAPTSPVYYTVTTTSGLVQTGENFANFKLSGIGGKKVTDLTGNGVTADDTGLGGVTINLYRDANGSGTLDANDTFIASQVTAVNTGYYYFSNAGPGTYFITETVPAGYVQTAPASTYYTVTTTSLGDSLYNNFANFQLITLSGSKWEDHNGNGIKDAGDQGLPGWTISLTKGAQTLTTQTDANGNYTFSNLGPGSYSVSEVQQAGWTCTFGAAGYTFSATSGVNVSRNFGNFQNYSISGQKFQDMNGNGIKDANDPGLQGFHITLDGVDKAVSDANGNYTITNVGPGSHTISEIQQAGYTKTVQPAAFTGSSGINVTGKDVGNFRNVTVSGQKFQDANFDGIKQPTETGLNGWTIQAINNKGQVIATAVTADVDLNNDNTIDPLTERGLYTLSIGPGTFTIREVLKTGWVQFAPLSGFHSVVIGGTYGLPSGSAVTGKLFGNAPLVPHNTKTLGFWSNKNGQNMLKGNDNFASTLAFLCNLNLKNKDGSNFDPTTYDQVHDWMLGGNSVNAAYMLSVQMATLALNVRYGFVTDATMVYAPGLLPFVFKFSGNLSPTGVISVGNLITAANASLAANPLTGSGSLARSYQTILSSVCDGCNNNKNFLT